MSEQNRQVLYICSYLPSYGHGRKYSSYIENTSGMHGIYRESVAREECINWVYVCPLCAWVRV